MRFINHVERYKGLKTAIKLNKEIRLSVTRYLSGEILSLVNTKMTYDGLPIKLGDLIPIIRSKQARVIQFAMTVLSVSRSVKVSAEPDISSITKRYEGFGRGNLTEKFNDFIKELRFLTKFPKSSKKIKERFLR